MRYVDIAIAGMIGLSSITAIASFTPRPGDLTSHYALEQIRARDALLAYLNQRGVAWFLESSTSEICADIASMSNGSVDFSATLGSVSCGGPHSNTRLIAALSLNLTRYEVTLEAWLSEGA